MSGELWHCSEHGLIEAEPGWSWDELAGECASIAARSATALMGTRTDPVRWLHAALRIGPGCSGTTMGE